MGSDHQPESLNRKANSITSHFKFTKPLLATSQKAGDASSTVWRLFPLISDGETDTDLGSTSDRGVSVSSQSTYSLASGSSGARASRGRARRDASDVKRVLKTITQVKGGTYKVKKGGPGGKYLVQRTLHHSGYKLLREELKKPENKELLDYVDKGRFRFDYIRRPCKGDKQFVIHMPSSFHEAMAGKLSDRIVWWLRDIANGALCNVDSRKEETMKIANGISSTLATRVKYDEPRDDQMEPDLSFTNEDCIDADLVVEVAWSQSNLKLPYRATRYIEGKQGAIRTVIGINMNDIYRGGCRATFSVWKAQHDGDKWRRTTEVDNKEFLDENGQPVDHCELLISLKDFICVEQTSEFGDFEDVSLKIPSTTLYDFYNFSFRRHIMSEANEGINGVKKKANDTSGKLSDIERIMLEQRTRNTRGRAAMGKTELADVRATILEIEKSIGEMKTTMEDVNEMMGKVGNRMERVEKQRAEANNTVSELETRLANARAEEERVVGANGKSIRSRVRSAFGLSSKK
ncbi:hypothetical protein NUW58_g9062 [Xylaria curta]|uniref:Uncharacterized protein n=1 Tax=Xylaria curta TaxID=42375 RepID=A0ACC1N2F9_9PEZI|nr:hypothetical protein NUW58_g9062 [Xylaria curta]